MKIAVDIRCLSTGQTGIHRYVSTILSELQNIDAENEYFLVGKRPSPFRPANARWKCVQTGAGIPGVLWTHTVLPLFLLRNRIEVLWAPEYVCPIVKFRGMRFVTTIYDFAYKRFPKSLRAKWQAVLSALVPFSVRLSDTICVISDAIKRELLSAVTGAQESRIAVVYCGRPVWRVPPPGNASARSDFLFFPGNLEPRKNLVNLLRALSLLREQGMRVPLHCAGPAGWKNRDLAQAITSGALEDQVVFRGYLSEDELVHEYIKCKAVVFPSLYEGFGMPVVEGLAMDCIVLTSKNTVMEEIAGPCAVYFDPCNPQDIADAIRRVVTGEVDAKHLLINRDARLSTFSWHESARKMLAVLTGREPASVKEIARSQLSLAESKQQ